MQITNSFHQAPRDWLRPRMAAMRSRRALARQQRARTIAWSREQEARTCAEFALGRMSGGGSPRAINAW